MALLITSLNCKGFTNSCNYINHIINEKEPTFMLLQETWHLDSTASILSNVNEKYLFKETSGIDSGIRIINGRPYGGLAIFFKRSLADKIEFVPCNNRRICAVRYKSEHHVPLLIINVYMPCDTQSSTSVNPIYADTMTDIEALISDHSGGILIGGDWNTDTQRNSAQTMCFNRFIERCDLNLGWNHMSAKKQDTYFSDINDSTSCIDHFVMSANVFDNLSSCYVNDNVLNPSDHRDIVVEINRVVTDCNDNVHFTRKHSIAWHKVGSDHINEYKQELDLALDSVDINYNHISCNDPECSNSSHCDSISNLCTNLIDICLESGNNCFPKTSPSRRHIPRWNSDIKPLREESIFWHSVWKDAGSPPSGALAGIMRNTRAKYHKAVKLHKRNLDNYRNSMIANAIDNGQQRDMWTELKKLDSKSKTTPCSINGCSDNVGIANIFADKYRDLYSSVPTCEQEIDQIRREMSIEINDHELFENVDVSVEDVCKATAKLNSNKRDGTQGTDSNHFIYSSHKMKIHISLLINSMFYHGFTPDKLLESVITSIPKNTRGNLCTDENYRGIALCSALCKVIDLVIIEKYAAQLMSSELQFSFKPEHSTNMCTSILKEVCSYYQARNTDVYICLLDASKAFDRVHYGKLFRLLSKRKIPVLVRRLLLDMYTRQKMQTVWNGSNSDTFTVLNGVKQGGILSPILFCLYIDELLLRINNSGLGCHIGHLSYAGLGYADDVTTITPSVSSLQSVLYICEEFAEEYNVSFNCKKTVCMRVGSGGRPPERDVTLNGTKLIWSKKVKHLGNTITHDLKDTEDINMKKYTFISQVNTLNSKFSTVHSSLRGRLLQTYCGSWYGCQTWDLASGSADCMNIEWNKAVRRTLNIPYRTRTSLLPFLIHGKSFKAQHRSRVSKFLDSFNNSSNSRVQYIYIRAKSYSHGALGRNLTRCRSDVPLDSTPADLVARAQAICELIDTRDGILDIPSMHRDEITFAIEFLCCY